MATSNFHLYHAKFQDLSDKALTFFIKSIKYKPESDHWIILRAKERIFNKEALRYLKKAVKELHGKV